LWRTLPFLSKFTHHVAPVTHPPKAPNNAFGKNPKPSDAECFFSNSTLLHALEQLVLVLRDIMIGFPAFLLAVASLVRLPSLIANIASVCITRQVCNPLVHLFGLPESLPGNFNIPCNFQISACEPVARTRTFNLVVSPSTDFIRFVLFALFTLYTQIYHNLMRLSC
jgi:hypothetical protein